MNMKATNITTAMAVYGSLDISGHDGKAGYPSSIDFDHLHAVQPGQEVKMPKGATVLTIRHGLQANLFLHTDDLADRAVFDLA